VNSLEWCRSKVQELASQGYNQSEISRKLQISQPTINRDLAYLRQIESLLAISVLLIASLLTITSPPSKMSSMAMMNVPSSSSSSTNMTGMSMTPIKNHTYVKETTMMNVNTKIEITPFYSGSNTFKVSFTDTQDKPYTKVSSVTMAFRNDQAGIGPIAANFNQSGPGTYTITGGYLS
jgi:hypothetical protein